MLIFDFECFKYDWMVCILDTETRQMYSIINDVEKFERAYQYYKNRIWVGYNSRGYDQWIAKAILAGFNPYEMNDWIINKDKKGHEFSRLLMKYPILNYDCSVGFRSLKELECFMGDSIVETSVPFDIDRGLTPHELLEVEKYCKHDVMETFKVFVEMKHEFESHIGLIREFKLPMSYISKTKAQISAEILGAYPVKRDDEFDITIVDTLKLDKYDFVRQWYLDWAKNSRSYDDKLIVDIEGVEHTFAFGGLHGALPKYHGEGVYVMADVASYYPAMMIEYNFLSRNVVAYEKYRAIRDERIIMKANKDPRQEPRKIVLNGTFGAQKDPYNKLFDPLNANNICITGQLLLLDLIEKIGSYGKLIQSNTDGVLYKLNSMDDYDGFVAICEEWSKRTRMDLEYELVSKVFQRDVNNYIIVDSKGKVKSKGAVVKQLNNLDNDLAIVNKAVKDYFIHNIPVNKTINECNELKQFQKITKISSKYEYGSHNNMRLHGKVMRCFASKDQSDGAVYKKHKDKDTLDKTASTPENSFIMNDDINGKLILDKLDKMWYTSLSEKRIKEFLEG